MGRYILGYKVENLILQLLFSVGVKLNFRLFIHQYTFQNENFEYSYPLNMCQNNYSITACPNCPGELVCLVDDDTASCQCPSGLIEKEPGKCRPPIGEYLFMLQ